MARLAHGIAEKAARGRMDYNEDEPAMSGAGKMISKDVKVSDAKKLQRERNLTRCPSEPVNRLSRCSRVFIRIDGRRCCSRRCPPCLISPTDVWALHFRRCSRSPCTLRRCTSYTALSCTRCSRRCHAGRVHAYTFLFLIPIQNFCPTLSGTGLSNQILVHVRRNFKS